MLDKQMALIKKVVGKLEDQDEQSKLLMELEKQKQGLDFKLESGMLLQGTLMKLFQLNNQFILKIPRRKRTRDY